MRLKLSFALISLLAAACAQEESGNVSANEVANRLAAVSIEPGLWETSSAIVGVSAPQLPYEVRRRMIGPRPSARGCITPERAGRFIAGGNCRYRQFSMTGGRMYGAMTCPALPRPTIATMEGDYGPHRYSFSMRMETAMPDGAAMSLDIRGQGRRIGDCPANAKGGVK